MFDGIARTSKFAVTPALEDTETEEPIRAQTVELLEGGRDPFKKREKRYALPA